MEMNPQRVRSAEFKSVRKGADPDEVRVFLSDVADELERAQNQATAMEARARAAVARLQEMSEAPAPAAPTVDASVEESETISRTLLLAQRTADSTTAAALAEASQIVAKAKAEAAKTIDGTREMSAQLLEDARIEARRAGEAERQSIGSEVESLKARRDFLESDVHHLETFLADQRARVREAATSLIDVADRVPGGLGEVRPPLLSASDDDTGELDINSAMLEESNDVDEPTELVIMTEIADLDAGEIVDTTPATSADRTPAVGLDSEPWADDDDVAHPVANPAADATQAMPAVHLEADAEPGGDRRDDTGESFRFSFDDERS